MSLKLNTRSLKKFIGQIIDNNVKLQNEGKRLLSAEICGEAGIGKTSAIIQICEERDLSIVKINLSQIEEIGDLVGFPVKEFEVCPPNGDCIWADEVAYTSYLSAGYKGTGRHRMAYAAPEWIQSIDNTKGGVLLLDDWTRADMRFIQACMELIDRQTYISWTLPKGWTVLLTSNPTNTADYIVTDIDIAQKTRYISIDLAFDAECWAEWAEGTVDDRCVNFVLLNPEIVKGEVNPRMLEMFFNTIGLYDNFEDNLSSIQQIGEATIGDSAATVFTLFINNRLDILPVPKRIFEGDIKSFILDISKYTKPNSAEYRADIASVLTLRLINYINKYADNNPITVDHVDRIETLITSQAIGEDNNYNLIRSIFNNNKRKFTAMIRRTTFMEHIQQ